MNNLKYCFLPLCFLLLATCSKKTEDDNPCSEDFGNDLELIIQDQFTTPPSKVSMFLKVDKRDGTPVSGLSSSAFRIFEKGRNDICENSISSFEAKAVISNPKQIFAYHTVLVLDLSASVTLTSLNELKTAATGFIDKVMPDSVNQAYYMGIWWFDGEDKLHELVPVTSDKADLQAGVASITSNLSNDSSTDLYGAVIKSTALATLLLSEYEQQEIISAASVVIFTDGTDQASRYLKADAVQAVKTAGPNIRFFSIGLGEEIDQQVLESIGKDSFVFAADQSELEATFQEIAEVVAAEANSYYLFEYCSPKRDGSGVNELRIEATTAEGDRGSVQTEFDATGFVGGCQ